MKNMENMEIFEPTEEEIDRVSKASKLIGDLPVIFNIASGVDYAKLRGFRKNVYVQIITNKN